MTTAIGDRNTNPAADTPPFGASCTNTVRTNHARGTRRKDRTFTAVLPWISTPDAAGRRGYIHTLAIRTARGGTCWTVFANMRRGVVEIALFLKVMDSVAAEIVDEAVVITKVRIIAIAIVALFRSSFDNSIAALGRSRL